MTNKPLRLSRTFCISLKQLVALLLLGIVVVAGVFWAVQRINTHRRWASMLRETQRLRTHLDAAAYGMSRQEFRHAYSSISELIILDKEHQIQLRKIDFMIETLLDPDIDLFKLNLTEIEAIHNIGWKLVKAYWNLLNYTSVNGVNGPPFWYFGPAPPDEGILEEAAQLATDVTTKIL